MSEIPREGWTLDHIGHAVKDLAAAERYYTQQLGFRLECRESLPDHLVDVSFLTGGGTTIELLAPQPGNRILSSFLDKRGEGVHHLAFRVASVGGELAKLKQLGMELIDKSPRPGSRNLWVAFVHPRSAHGVLLELCGEAEE